VDSSKVLHITLEIFNRASDVTNVAVFLNNRADESLNEENVNEEMSGIVEKLESLLDLFPDQVQRQVEFLCEQLNLLSKVPKRRQFSSHLLSSCAVAENITSIIQDSP